MFNSTKTGVRRKQIQNNVKKDFLVGFCFVDDKKISKGK